MGLKGEQGSLLVPGWLLGKESPVWYFSSSAQILHGYLRDELWIVRNRKMA